MRKGDRMEIVGRTWWRRPFVVGFAGTLAALLIVALLAAVGLVWVRAAHGQAAFDFLQRVQQQQQAATPPAAERPAK